MSMGKARTITLDNGLEFVFRRDSSAPVMALDLWVKVGGASETEREAGLAHVVEHMLFKGTRKRGPGQIAREVESAGGEINAFTSFENTVYILAIASRYTELAMDILSDAAFSSAFDTVELEREKPVILEEIKRGKDMPNLYLSRMLFSEAYAEHPYGSPVIGDEASVRSFTSGDCKRFVAKWYRPSNMTLVAVGDGDFGEMVKLVKKYFGVAKRKPNPRRTARKPEPAHAGFRGRFEPRDVSDVYFNLAFPGPSATAPDAVIVDVMMGILAQGEASRLQNRVKLETNLVHMVGGGAFSPRDPGLLYVAGVCDTTKTPEAYSTICEELFKLAGEVVGSHELTLAKENIEADFIYQKETVQGHAQKLGYFHDLFGDTEHEQWYLEELRRVDGEAVRQCAEKYFDPDNGVIALIHPRDKKPGLTVKRAAKLLAGKASMAKRPERTKRSGPGVMMHTLESGVRIVLQPSDSVPIVAVRAALLGGSRMEKPSQAGSFHLLADCFLRGSADISVFDIAREIDGINGHLDGFSGRNSFGLKGEFLSKHFERGIALFSEVLCGPTFPEDEVAKAREDGIASLKLRRDNPAGWAFRLFEKCLYGSHPYSRDVLGVPETIEKFTPKVLKKLFESFFMAENLVITLVGDIDPDFAVEQLERDLTFPAKAKPLPASPRPPEVVAGKKVFREEAAQEQSHMLAGFLGARVNDEDRYALKVANAMLTGQGGRLFRRLRDEMGLAYSVTSLAIEGLDRGYAAGYIATTPDRTGEALEAMMNEYAKLVRGEFTGEEVGEAQRKLVGGFELSCQENGFRAGQMALDELYGLGHHGFLDFAGRILKVGKGDVVRAAEKYFTTEDYVAVILGP